MNSSVRLRRTPRGRPGFHVGVRRLHQPRNLRIPKIELRGQHQWLPVQAFLNALGDNPGVEFQDPLNIGLAANQVITAILAKHSALRDAILTHGRTDSPVCRGPRLDDGRRREGRAIAKKSQDLTHGDQKLTHLSMPFAIYQRER